MRTTASHRQTGMQLATWWREDRPGVHVAVAARPVRRQHVDATRGAMESTRSARRKRKKGGDVARAGVRPNRPRQSASLRAVQ
jgi:hypothetical protein